MGCFINWNKYTIEGLRLKFSSEKHTITNNCVRTRLISFYITPNERFIVQIMCVKNLFQYIIKLYEKIDEKYVFINNLCEISNKTLPFINIHITKLDIDLNWIEISNTCFKNRYNKSCYINLHCGEEINKKQILLYDSDDKLTYYKCNNTAISNCFEIDYDPLYYKALTTYHKLTHKLTTDYENQEYQNELRSILCKISFYKSFLYIREQTQKELHKTIAFDNCLILDFNVTDNGYAILLKDTINTTEFIIIF
jgi:hypothetical protein